MKRAVAALALLGITLPAIAAAGPSELIGKNIPSYQSAVTITGETLRGGN